MAHDLTVLGLILTLVGAALLFVYGLPQKRVGNVMIVGLQSIKWTPGPGERDTPESEWQPKANRFLSRAKFLNRLGFALIAIGTLLQIIAVVRDA